MNSETPPISHVERVDDLPVLLATLARMNVAEILDRHFPSGHRWMGELTFGEVACVWIAFLTSQGDHCLSHLESWVASHLHTLSACLGKTVRPLDFHDDRLADMLDRLSQGTSWQDCEADLNQEVVRVYDLKANLFRIDTTTANTYSAVQSEQGYFQFGHSKDRDDQPQIKIALAPLDPLGLPVTTFVVPGNRADDPLYIPEMKKVQRSFGSGGKTFVGDCKAAALATRAYLAHSGDYYLCPLSETHVNAQQRQQLLEPLWQAQQTLQQVYAPAEQGHEQELVAEGFFVDVPLQTQVEGKTVCWTERRWLVRSLAFAAAAQEKLKERLFEALLQLAALSERKQGKKRLTASEMAAAAEAIVKKHRVQGMLDYRVRATTREKHRRAYGDRPAIVVKEQEHYLELSRDDEAIEEAKRQIGWRVYATNQVSLSLEAVVWGYRGQNRLEENWSRLKGRPLGLTPMYLQCESRIVGLVLLLSLALRLLKIVEWTARKRLQEQDGELRGVYPGQKGRKTSRPSAELLLQALKGIHLVVVETAEGVGIHITALTALQQRLLELWQLPPDLYQRIAAHFSKPPSILSRTDSSEDYPVPILEPFS
jgi:transposase